MWTADKWRDYELLDCSDGEKLERWGRYTLVRPDPQAIWDTPRTNTGWSAPDGRYSRVGTDGIWDKKKLPDNWEIRYGDLRFNIKPMSFKHTGIFPEQAENWEFIRQTIEQARFFPNDGPIPAHPSGVITDAVEREHPVRVINLFAYTGAATLAAAAAGAEVTHVDAAKGMVAWARENAKLSALDGKPIRWIVDDCKRFVEREIRRGRKYDAIIMDPPSFGRGPDGQVWKIENDLWNFVGMCSGLLSENPIFVLISSYTSGLAPSVLTYICRSVFESRYGGKTVCDELGLPVTESGFVLPCGSACRWTFGTSQ